MNGSSNDPFAAAARGSIEHYLDRTDDLLRRVTDEPSPDRLLAIRLAPDMHDTGWQFAVAIRFAGRSLCPFIGREAPDIPNERTCANLLAFNQTMRQVIGLVGTSDMLGTVRHDAGEAIVEQDAADHVLRFGLPNMLFHLTTAYVGLRMGGMKVGKADFDGLHRYDMK